MATHAFHRYGVNSEAVAIDAPEVTFRRIPISGGERERLGPQLGAKFDEILYKYGAGEFIFDEKVCLKSSKIHTIGHPTYA